MALERSIIINIYTDRPGARTVDVPKAVEKNEEQDALLVRLAARDDMPDDQRDQLLADVISYVDGRLKLGEYSKMKKFVLDNMAKFDPDMKDIIAEKIRQHKFKK